MQKLVFSIDIKASKEKVWYSLWDDDNYQNWTSAFCEGCYTISNWEQGSKILFLMPNGSGMSSVVNINKPFETMCFKHLREIKEFREMPETEESKLWSGSDERYDISESDGFTTVSVSMDIVDSHAQYFKETFPKAMQKLKEIAEAETKSITVRIATKETREKTWDFFTNPKHIVSWCFASDDWHAPKAENDLREGGTFSTTMAAKDGSFSFDFGGIYNEVVPMEKFSYTMGDGRKVSVKFDMLDNEVILTENFEPELQNPMEMQRTGWQMILENFKKYLEKH